VLRAAQRRLRAVPSPGADARLLLAHALDVSPSRLLLVADVSPETAARFAALVERRAAGEPVQHLTGEAPFRHETVRVGPGVFIPRPETEVMTGWVVDRLRGSTGTRVVELCTGSGAIGLALSREVPDARIWAVERDADALRWARRNLSASRVTLVAGDMDTALPELDGTVDVVVANPPYVPLAVASSLPADVAHDPPQAVFAGEDGLSAVRIVARVAARLLRPGGFVACEHDDTHGRSAPALFAATGVFDQVTDHDDLAGKPRFVTGRRC
jgi:release factor glutamine methyltransferase